MSDFDHFVDKTYMGYDMGRGTSSNDEIWKKQMFSLKGEEWKSVRGAVTPIFTPLKLKKMVPLVNKAEIYSEDHESSIFRQSSNPACGSWKSQASSPWAKQHRA